MQHIKSIHISCDKKRTENKGFTLIEVLIVIGIIGILAAVVLVAINPARQFKLARDSQRVSNVNALLNAMGQNIADNRGVFTCSGSQFALPHTATVIKSGTTGVDLAPCLVPTYLSSLPFDPSAGGAHYSGPTDYDTSYSLSEDANGRLTVSAVAEISSNSPIQVVR